MRGFFNLLHPDSSPLMPAALKVDSTWKQRALIIGQTPHILSSTISNNPLLPSSSNNYVNQPIFNNKNSITLKLITSMTKTRRWCRWTSSKELTLLRPLGTIQLTKRLSQLISMLPKKVIIIYPSSSSIWVYLPRTTHMTLEDNPLIRI